MLTITDRALGILLVVGGILHGVGSFMAFANALPSLVWALSGSLAALLIAAINLLRSARGTDRPLAWISLCGCLAWIAIAVAFGRSIDNVLDPRVLYHVIVTLGLTAFSLRDAVGGRRHAATA
jgi:hypothetical protein